MEYYKIIFEIKTPENWRQSTLNSLIYFMRDLKDFEINKIYSYKGRIRNINVVIDKMINQLETLKIKELKGGDE